MSWMVTHRGVGMAQAKTVGARITVRGVVQGVGFRPFVYRIAHEHGIRGWVVNSTAGVIIECDGTEGDVREFERAITAEAPTLARVDAMERTPIESQGFDQFEIRPSEAGEGEVTLICPDVAVCPDCLREFLDPSDRRYQYPFINCTNCGPRFSIIEETPYDRPKTSMRTFIMCPECRREYENPLDRRFHAQPNACRVCGPALELVMPTPAGSGTAELITGRSYLRMPNEIAAGVKEDPSAAARWLLKHGGIIGVRGLGGFHIAAAASLDVTVRALREKKNRPAKPFAIMCRSLDVARRLVYMDPIEEKVLRSPWSPIVLLKRRKDAEAGMISGLVAPNNAYLGVVLPYAPLHHLLFDDELEMLIMTSANVSGEPIVADPGVALEQLAGTTRTHLTHDRDIVNRNDDSVVFVEVGRVLMSRRSRGYAPYPIDLETAPAPPASMPAGSAVSHKGTQVVLACGTELKNTFTLLDGNRAYVSQHIGDMENQPTLDFYEEMLERFLRWFRVEPGIVAHDLHPDYLATRFAKRYAADAGGRVRLMGVQHHHAHIVSVMAENGVTDTVIGIALDGTGYGTDGAIWGCEFLVADRSDFERAGHLKYTPLPGGDAAIRHPYRVALAHLHAAGEGDLSSVGRRLFPEIDRDELDLVVQQIEKNVNCIATSSAGRLFDAVSAILGVCHEISYEAQAAIELESLINREEGGQDSGCPGETSEPHYPYELIEAERGFVIDAGPTVLAVLADVLAGTPREVIAHAFHNTVVRFAADACGVIARAANIDTVALSGGVFQNRYLLKRLVSSLETRGFRVLLNREVPANDGGVSLGQAVVAGERAARGLE